MGASPASLLSLEVATRAARASHVRVSKADEFWGETASPMRHIWCAVVLRTKVRMEAIIRIPASLSHSKDEAIIGISTLGGIE